MPLLEVQARDARLELIIEHALQAPASCALEERIKALSLAARSGLTRCFSLLAHASESCGWGAGAKQLRWVALSAPAPHLEPGRLACFDTAYNLGWDLGALYDLSLQSKKITSSLLACAHLGFGSTEAAHDSQGILDGLDARCRRLIELGVPAVFYYPNISPPYRSQPHFGLLGLILIQKPASGHVSAFMFCVPCLNPECLKRLLV